MNLSPIEWTDYTANPIRYRDPDGNVVHACIHKSSGCLHCYAETLAKRWGRKGLPFTAENMKRLTPFLDENELHRMRRHRPADGKRCFIGDMTDIFGEWIPDDLLNELFTATLEMRENVQWQILTKRADRMHEYLSWRWGEGRIPMRNIWVGVSVEDQKTADERIPLLLNTRAAIRFASYEPALSVVDFRRVRPNPFPIDALTGRWGVPHQEGTQEPRLHWLIVGGESGPGARVFDTRWARAVIAQCRGAGVPVFVKQLGGLAVDQLNESPAFDVLMNMKSRKGGDMAEWPEDLRVREFPQRELSHG